MATKKPARNAPAAKAGVGESIEEMRERKRAAARRRAQEREEARKEELKRNVGAGGKLRGRPQVARTNWELSAEERARFDRSHGVTEALNQIRDRIHPDDVDLVFNALGATMSFRQLDDIVDELTFADPEDLDIEDVAKDLKGVRVGFELALQALDKALGDRGVVLDGHSRGGKNKSEPEWHRGCIELAKLLLANGTDKRDLVGKLAQRIGRDRTSIARVLRKAGIK